MFPNIYASFNFLLFLLSAYIEQMFLRDSGPGLELCTPGVINTNLKLKYKEIFVKAFSSDEPAFFFNKIWKNCSLWY